MGLRRKTFLYSIILAGLMTAFVLGYFVLMLPSLYVDYVMKSNLDLIGRVQQGYMEERSYDGLTVKNPSSVVTLELPDEGNDFYLKGKFFSLMIGVRDKELQEILADARAVMDAVRAGALPDRNITELTADCRNAYRKYLPEGMCCRRTFRWKSR